jgi:hypothetical protein
VSGGVARRSDGACPVCVRGTGGGEEKAGGQGQGIGEGQGAEGMRREELKVPGPVVRPAGACHNCKCYEAQS